MLKEEKNCLSAKHSNAANTHDCESVIVVEGIPFTKEVLKDLKQWIIPHKGFDMSDISGDIDSLTDVESFIFDNYGYNSDGGAEKVLDLLSFIHRFKGFLKELADLNPLVKEGGES
jgi:hypothetical protein